MRKLQLTLVALALTVTTLQAQQLPEKVYLHQNGQHRTAVFNYPYLQSLDIYHRPAVMASLVGRNDSLRFTIVDGQQFDYHIGSVDSITYYAPDALMRDNIAWQDQHPSQFYPVYSDDYRNNSGWNSRSSWQLANIHDPTVMKAADGYYYMSQTDASFGGSAAGKGHFYVRRSKDLVKWEPASSYNNSMAMKPNIDSYGNEVGPAWLLDSVNVYREKRGVEKVNTLQGLGFWAPCIRKVHDQLYRMYYSIVIDGVGIKTGLLKWDSENNAWQSDGGSPEPAWIGLLETDDPASGIWEDKGGVLCSASDKGKDDYVSTGYDKTYALFNAIDPSYIITPYGEHWLIYGSWHSGIAAIQLDPSTGKPLQPVGNPWDIGTGQTTRYGKRIATRVPSGYWSRWQGSEGPEVVYNPQTDYYYLFLAYDGLDVPYNTRVVRSRSVDGPYVGKDGKNVTDTGGDAFPVVTHPYQFNSDLARDGWVGISHCAVWDDGQGNWYYSSQGRKPNDYSNNPDWAPNAIMMGHVRRIFWTPDGWPVVSPERYGNVEQAPIAASDLVGQWELIDLTYKNGEQKMSQSVTIAPSSLTADRVVLSGAYSGSAKFDAQANQLTVGSGSTAVTFCVSRELDWEASPRRATIVMCGLRSATQTYWLKRVGD